MPERAGHDGENRVVDLMEVLETSVRQARSAREERVAERRAAEAANPLLAVVPSPTTIVASPHYEKWVERVAIFHCTDITRDHDTPAIPCNDCLRWAREIAARKCYECGVVVLEGQGEKHGRAGWVHTDCIEDDDEWIKP